MVLIEANGRLRNDFALLILVELLELVKKSASDISKILLYRKKTYSAKKYLKFDLMINRNTRDINVKKLNVKPRTLGTFDINNPRAEARKKLEKGSQTHERTAMHTRPGGARTSEKNRQPKRRITNRDRLQVPQPLNGPPERARSPFGGQKSR